MIVTPVLYAPKEYREMSEGAKKNICNGCGSDSTECVPEHIWGLRVSEACNIHDYMYYESVKKFGGPAFWAGKNDSKNLGGEI